MGRRQDKCHWQTNFLVSLYPCIRIRYLVPVTELEQLSMEVRSKRRLMRNRFRGAPPWNRTQSGPFDLVFESPTTTHCGGGAGWLVGWLHQLQL